MTKSNLIKWRFPWDASPRSKRMIRALVNKGFGEIPEPGVAGKRRLIKLLNFVYNKERVLISCQSDALLNTYLSYCLTTWACTFNSVPFTLDYYCLKRLINADVADIDDDDDYRECLVSSPLAIPRVDLLNGGWFKNFAAFLSSLIEARKSVRSRGNFYPRVILTSSLDRDSLQESLNQSLGALCGSYISENFDVIRFAETINPPEEEVVS